jgi:hypothetical protein
VPDSCTTGDVLRLSQVTSNLLTNVRSALRLLRDGLSSGKHATLLSALLLRADLLRALRRRRPSSSRPRAAP